MTTSVGVDLIEIARVRRAMGKYPSFTERCFTEAERAYCDSRPNPAQHYAARFAGKEAVGKALGFGVARNFAWREVEIAGRPKPSVRLHGRLEQRAARLGVDEVDLSMTHSKELAAAIAIASEGLAVQTPLYTAAEMKDAEAGHDVRELMERAGRAVAEEALRHFPDAQSFGAVCGGGANGGDARIALEALRAAGREADEGLDGDVVIDGLFGTGFHGEPRADASEVIAQMNAAEGHVLSVDLPSGVDADTGEVAGAAVWASVTVALHAPKIGNVVAPGSFHGGELVVRDIGLEHSMPEHALVTTTILGLVPRKGPGDTKYSASVLVVGGAPGLTGAACLAAEAAFRADAGYVAVAAPAESLPVLEARLLEAVKRPLDEVFDAVEKAGALAIGPGLGRDEGRRELVRRLLEETDLPAVVDADALFGLEPVRRSAPTVLTPHAGELARLLGVESEWVDAHRFAAVRQAADAFGCTCLLKGSDTLVATPGQGVLVCAGGPPSLATAGTGDVLTGTVAAFLAKGLDARHAAAAGAVACAEAARLGPERGLVASDVVNALPDALDAF